MIQGGDPTGTGRGGESMYGEKFADEITRVSQANVSNGALNIRQCELN